MPDLVLFKDTKEILRFPLNHKDLSIGRSSSNDIVLTDETISRFHARLTVIGGAYKISNFGSRNLLVNGQAVQEHAMQDGDVIKIGDYELRFRRHGASDEAREASVLTSVTRINEESTQVLSAREDSSIELAKFYLESPFGKVSLNLSKKGFTVGNSNNNDLVLNDPYVSGTHLKFQLKEGAVHVFDTGSTNGTYVNGRKVSESSLCIGDEIKIGESKIKLLSDASIEELAPLENGFFCGMIGGPTLRVLFSKIKKVAPTDLTVLIEAESGCGKELVARSLHDLSLVAKGPYVIVNCGAISAELIESELFGHEKGAFTGALQKRLGAFELAHNGTLFLDEIGELPLNLQPKLLRALENRTIRRVGGEAEVKVSVRVIAATNRNLQLMVQDSEFREDLYYRLNVIHLKMPPLRDRMEDIPNLVQHFIRLSDPVGVRRFSESAMKQLMDYHWPGNVRELKNVVLKALVFGDDVIEAEDIELSSKSLMPIAELPKTIDLEEAERQKILEALALAQGERKKTAELLGIARSTLFKKLKAYGIQ